MTVAGDGEGGRRPIAVPDGGDPDPQRPPVDGPGVEDPAIERYGMVPDRALRGDADDLERRVDDLLARARGAREAFLPPEELPATDPDERALAYCRRGLWPVLALYVDRRGAGARLGQPHHGRLEEALNVWLDLYARCYGESITPAFSVREAAELFVSTHNVRDVAQLLTDVPDRRRRGSEPG